MGSKTKSHRELVRTKNKDYLELLNSLKGVSFKNDQMDGTLNYTDLSEYKLGKMLGQGSYAIVRDAIHIQSGMRVAVKIYDKLKLNSAPHIKKSVQREIKMLSYIRKASH
jgi:serine/threonine protein kinase